MKTIYICVFCDQYVTNQTYCEGCNEYKGVSTLDDYVFFMDKYPEISVTN